MSKNKSGNPVSRHRRRREADLKLAKNELASSETSDAMTPVVDERDALEPNMERTVRGRRDKITRVVY